MERSPGSHPGAELLLPVGMASRASPVAGHRMTAGSGTPSWGWQQRAEASGQAGAGGRGEHQQRRQREEAQYDERCRSAVREQGTARGAGRRVDLRARRTVRRGWWGLHPGMGPGSQGTGRELSLHSSWSAGGGGAGHTEPGRGLRTRGSGEGGAWRPRTQSGRDLSSGAGPAVGRMDWVGPGSRWPGAGPEFWRSRVAGASSGPGFSEPRMDDRRPRW